MPTLYWRLNPVFNLEEEQNILNEFDVDDDNFIDSSITQIITVSATTIEKINQNLFKASEIHEERNRKSWSEASRYYAGK